MPYRDLYDGTAPLAAAFFAGLDAVLARPVWLYRVVALLLLLLQALRLNLVFNRYDVHPERGYVAALTYLLVGSVSTDLDTLSPLLLGHTFIVFALSALLPTSREGYDNRRLFRAGFLIGLGALCYLPLGLFVLVGLFAVVIFAANSFRSSLLLLCGFFFPYALVATFFFYAGGLPGLRAVSLAARPGRPHCQWAASGPAAAPAGGAGRGAGAGAAAVAGHLAGAGVSGEVPATDAGVAGSGRCHGRRRARRSARRAGAAAAAARRTSACFCGSATGKAGCWSCCCCCC